MGKHTVSLHSSRHLQPLSLQLRKRKRKDLAQARHDGFVTFANAHDPTILGEFAHHLTTGPAGEKRFRCRGVNDHADQLAFGVGHQLEHRGSFRANVIVRRRLLPVLRIGKAPPGMFFEDSVDEVVEFGKETRTVFGFHGGWTTGCSTGLAEVFQ